MSEFSNRVKLNEKIANCIINSSKYLYSWYEGSAQCGKSVAAALGISLIIENSKKEDNLFLALGYTNTSAKNNIFDCGGFGVKAYFGSRCKSGKYEGADCLKIKTRTGLKYLVAFGTSTKTSNNAWHGWRVSGAVFDEIDRACLESVSEIQQRITAVEDPHVIITQNPNDPNLPIYKWLEDLQSRNLVNYKHFILDDNPGLSKEKILEIKNRYDPESIFYKRFVLGERIVADNLIYNLRDYNIIDSFDPNDYIDYIIVCDQGETVSSSAFILLAMRKGFKGVDILENYKHRNADKPSRPDFKFAKDYADDLAMFTYDCIETMNGVYPKVVYIDRSESFYRECCNSFQKKNLNYSLLKYAIKKEISERVKQGINLLYRGKLRFFKNCQDVIDDFKSAQFDPKESNKGIITRLKIYNSAGHGDNLDAVEYGFSHYMRELFREDLKGGN